MSPRDARRSPLPSEERARQTILGCQIGVPVAGRRKIVGGKGAERQADGLTGVPPNGEVPCRSDLYTSLVRPLLFLRAPWNPSPNFHSQFLISDLVYPRFTRGKDKMGVKEFIKKRPLKARDNNSTNAAELTLKQSIFPIVLVTILFFLWGFSYGKRDCRNHNVFFFFMFKILTCFAKKGLLDTLNKHFQEVLNITRARSGGLQAAYFGCVYPPSIQRHRNISGRKIYLFLKANIALSEPTLSRQSVMRPGSSATGATKPSSSGASSSTVSVPSSRSPVSRRSHSKAFASPSSSSAMA